MAWKLLFAPSNRLDGHRIFINDEGLISLCDLSGLIPSRTDDGPLIVNPGSTVTVGVWMTTKYGTFDYSVPVYVERGDREGFVSTTHATAVALFNMNLNLKIKINEKAQHLIDQVDWMRNVTGRTQA